MNIGVLGGTFDPPHEAHLRIAERSIDQFNLDRVIFIPSGNPWQKKDATSYRHRYEMTKILIGDSNDLEISDIENSEKNPSYTYETLNKLNHPKEKLYFILGSDAAINIKTWKKLHKNFTSSSIRIFTYYHSITRPQTSKHGIANSCHTT